MKTTIALLLSALAVSFSVMAGELPTTETNVSEMRASIASFGVSEDRADEAAIAAMEEIAERKRGADHQAATTVSQVPDDLLEISPYDL